MADTIIYDQPLNEVIRVCLRLEQLFQCITHQLLDQSELGTRSVINSIIQVLNITDRPDLKVKLAKEMTLILTNLNRRPSPQVEEYQNALIELSRILIDSSGKIGHRLREIELLNHLRLQLASPSSGCGFDVPLYHYWLQQPSELRQKVVHEWLMEFTLLQNACQLVISLIKNNAKVEEKQAIHGFHQELLDPHTNLRMIRIGILKTYAVYPEFSIGRHFLSARFFVPDIEKRPVQYAANLPFWIAYCNA